MTISQVARPPLPPFTLETAVQKVRLAEDGWNSRNPEKVSLAYAVDSVWRNRSEFVTGRDAIVQFLTRKWNRELEYRLIKELWAFHEIGSPSASPTSGTTTVATGFVPTATRTGNSTGMAS
jgi:nuclear transport factor 2 (NTF2) superfamily protein